MPFCIGIPILSFRRERLYHDVPKAVIPQKRYESIEGVGKKENKDSG